VAYAAGIVAGSSQLPPFFWVLKANRFAAAIIQVESGQTVTDTGPYRLVRHPLYSSSIVLWLAAPLALGSFVALPVFVLIIPVLFFRLLNEEKILRGTCPAMPNTASAPATGWFRSSGKAAGELIVRTSCEHQNPPAERQQCHPAAKTKLRRVPDAAVDVRQHDVVSSRNGIVTNPFLFNRFSFAKISR
jgi:hypothetical protein